MERLPLIGSMGSTIHSWQKMVGREAPKYSVIKLALCTKKMLWYMKRRMPTSLYQLKTPFPVITSWSLFALCSSPQRTRCGLSTLVRIQRRKSSGSFNPCKQVSGTTSSTLVSSFTRCLMRRTRWTSKFPKSVFQRRSGSWLRGRRLYWKVTKSLRSFRRRPRSLVWVRESWRQSLSIWTWEMITSFRLSKRAWKTPYRGRLYPYHNLKWHLWNPLLMTRLSILRYSNTIWQSYKRKTTSDSSKVINH